MMNQATAGASLLLLIGVYGWSNGNCTDFKRQIVTSNQRYIPMGFDACHTCTCQDGKPEMCVSVQCSPPKHCINSQMAEDKCCEFKCMNVDAERPPIFNITTVGNKDSDALSTTNLGLRLVASTVTSFLILALLLFMIHRLRQRRLLLMIRRFNNNQLGSGPVRNRRFSMDPDGTVGYFPRHGTLDFGLYDDPPPPYTFWKPPESYFPQGEAPPPYEAALNVTRSFALPPVTPERPSPSMNITTNSNPGLPNLRMSFHPSTDFQMNDLGQDNRSATAHQSLPSYQPNVMCSTTSLTSLNEADANSNTHAGIADSTIRSDAVYEDMLAPSLNGQPTGYCLQATINERRISNVPGNTVIDSNLPETTNHPQGHKCRSYNEIADCWQHDDGSSRAPSSDPKRRSLQGAVLHALNFSGGISTGPCTSDYRWVPDISGNVSDIASTHLDLGKQRKSLPESISQQASNSGINKSLLLVSSSNAVNYCPDPTAWTPADASESSSSSSPTYEQRTVSPTSSESSSSEFPFPATGSNGDTSAVAATFPRNSKNAEAVHQQPARQVRLVQTSEAACIPTDTCTQATSTDELVEKANSLPRTFSAIKQKMMLKKRGRKPEISAKPVQPNVIAAARNNIDKALTKPNSASSSATNQAPLLGAHRQNQQCQIPCKHSSADHQSEAKSKTVPIMPHCIAALRRSSSPTATQRRAPRISYISDGDVPFHFPGGRKDCKTLPKDSSKYKVNGRGQTGRPRSYDFGDLSETCNSSSTTIIEEATGSREASSSDSQRTDCGCSLSSATCSSRASFGSSFSSPSREGPASPSSLCSPLYPSSPILDHSPSLERIVPLGNGMHLMPPAPASSPVPSGSAHLVPVLRVGHSRSSSICSETGELKQPHHSRLSNACFIDQQHHHQNNSATLVSNPRGTSSVLQNSYSRSQASLSLPACQLAIAHPERSQQGVVLSNSSRVHQTRLGGASSTPPQRGGDIDEVENESFI